MDDDQTGVVPAEAGTSWFVAKNAQVPAFAGTTLKALVLPLFLAACTAPSDLPAGSAPLDPIAFFAGVTNGEGSLDTIVARPVPVTVSSLGFREHGGLKLIQRIKEGDQPLRIRTWVIRKVPSGYVSTLTDAQGMVEMELRGARAYIGYTTPSGLRIHQQLALQPDGRTVRNRLTAHKYGVRLAILDETIRK